MQLICSTEVSLVFRTIPKPIDAFSRIWHKFKSSVTVATWVLAFAIIKQQPLQLPHYCGISHLQSVAGTTQTLRFILPLLQGLPGFTNTEVTGLPTVPAVQTKVTTM